MNSTFVLLFQENKSQMLWYSMVTMGRPPLSHIPSCPPGVQHQVGLPDYPGRQILRRLA